MFTLENFQPEFQTKDPQGIMSTPIPLSVHSSLSQVPVLSSQGGVEHGMRIFHLTQQSNNPPLDELQCSNHPIAHIPLGAPLFQTSGQKSVGMNKTKEVFYGARGGLV